MQCDRRAALDGLFSQLFQSPYQEIALIGSGCSAVNDATTEISYHYNLTHVIIFSDLWLSGYTMSHACMLALGLSQGSPMLINSCFSVCNIEKLNMVQIVNLQFLLICTECL